ncbi:hypothetical protein Pan216_34020 [Planctomycetes bacterium Pan216]|uniref:Uncharacterized protein n=1 Tax=Kolteria novifilia TaxID=2527975 RepID=A0A518B6D1_9BACT|nr:hypothetical protein Pan216_34020 [Planctomycetes bacterium Pan216]
MRQLSAMLAPALLVAFGAIALPNQANAQTSADRAIEANNTTTLTFQQFVKQLQLIGGQPARGIDQLDLITYIDATKDGFADARRGSTGQAVVNGTLDPNIMQYSPPDPAALGLSDADSIRELIVEVVNDYISQLTPPNITTYAPATTDGNGVVGNTISGIAFSTNTGNGVGISPNKNIPVSEGGSNLTFSASRF